LKRVGLEIALFQAGVPMCDQFQNCGNLQMLVLAGVFRQIRSRQFEQGGRRTKPVLLQVDKGARQLDQAFVKSAVGAVPVLEPKLFQDIMRLVIQAFIKIIEVALVIRIKPAGQGWPNHVRDPLALIFHASL